MIAQLARGAVVAGVALGGSAHARADSAADWIARGHRWEAVLDAIGTVTEAATDATLALDCGARSAQWTAAIINATRAATERLALADTTLFEGGRPEAATTAFAILTAAITEGHREFRLYGTIACGEIRASERLKALDKRADIAGVR